ncbi:MAG: pilus assembly protein PilM, partial [Planctomycetes bacterium]|nr:pilus assembly protein PilM [Planctomycetota bacterium]
MQWNLEQLRKFGRKDVFGLDIGSSAVKMVQLSRSGNGYTVNAAGVTACKSDNAAGVINAVRDCLEASGIGAQLAVCSISGPEVAARGFKFPSLLPEEIAGAVQFEAAQICPFNVNDAAVEYQLIHNDNEPIQGVLVAATNSVIERKKLLVKNSHLDCCLMDIDGLALLNCFNE